MTHPHTTHLSTRLRLLCGLALLIGLCIMLGGLARPAHAQSTLSVSDCSGETGPGDIGTVISSASAGDTITFSCSGTIPITSTLTISTNNLTLDGSGQTVTLDGGNSTQVLSVKSGVTFTLKTLTIAHGLAPFNSMDYLYDGGGLYNDGGTVTISNSTFTNNSAPDPGFCTNGGEGGGLFNQGGTVTISSSTFTNNSAIQDPCLDRGGAGGGLFNYQGTVSISTSTFSGNSAPGPLGAGGGLYNQVGTLSISTSTFSGNSASGADGTGGGLLNGFDGTLSISTSTFSGNSAPDGGGAISNTNDGELTISNSTFSGNSASGDGSGGGLSNYGNVNIGGSIVANNSGGNCFNGYVSASSDQGYNLSSDSSCGLSGTGSVQNTDPKLGSLASNGGPTLTMALQQGSPAINQIPSSACLDGNGQPLTADQRGIARPQGSACDMGAFEFRAPVLKLPNTITTSATSAQGAVVNYTVTASEPDDASATPTVSCAPASGSAFPIGSTTVNCTASDAATPADTSTGSFQVVVNPAVTASGKSVSPTEGSAFSGVVATGTDSGAGTLSASIDWGDGSSSAGTVNLNADGSYNVTGSHTYAEEGSFALKVTVHASGGPSASGTGSATVGDAALNLSSPSVVIKGVAVALSTSFTDADPNGTLSDYTASITWGDGSTSAATLGKNSSGSGFVAVGAHNYVKHGTYTLTVTIKDAGGSTVTKTVTIKV